MRGLHPVPPTNCWPEAPKGGAGGLGEAIGGVREGQCGRVYCVLGPTELAPTCLG